MNTTSNGMRLIDFTAARNMVICSTKFQHLDIHKATWMSPDRLTLDQIDHIVIDGRHVSSVLNVYTFRGPNIDLDHYLSQPSFDCALARRGLHALVHSESWKLKSCDHKGQLKHSPLNSLISSVVPHPASASLVDCEPTSPTSCALLRKQSLYSSTHHNEINRTMRSAAKNAV